MQDTSAATTPRQKPTSVSAMRAKALSLTAWIILGPLIFIWPVVSSFPVFSLVNEPGSVWNISVQLAVFASGFWGIAGLLTVWAIIKQRPAVTRAGNWPKTKLAFWLGIYAFAWVVAYAYVVWAGLLPLQ